MILSVPRSEQFSESVNCELRGTDNVQGQISEHVFAPNGGHRVYYPPTIFLQGAQFGKFRNIRYSPVFAGEYSVT